MISRKFLPGLLIAITLAACNNEPSTPEVVTSEPQTAIINYAVIKTFPHDINSYTEGLVVHNNQLFESTGSPDDLPQTRSVIGILDTATGKLLSKVEIDRKRYFGEGLVFLKDRLYQLTYHNHTGFIYDAKTFNRIDSFTFSNREGWGLTTNGTHLIMSDSTDILTYVDPATMKPVKTLKVTENGRPLYEVNELELINGFIYANVWKTNYIVKIDSTSGNVVGKLDISSLANEARASNPGVDVANGIAFDPVSRRIFVTGKLWPSIYEISFPH